MKKFEFRLEKLLRLRGHMERIQQIETLQQEHRVSGLIQSEAILNGEVRDTVKSLAPARGERWKGEEQRNKIEYLGRLEILKVSTESERRKEEEVLSTLRQRLVERSRNRKTVEALKRRRFEGWNQEREREEQKELDEIGQRKHCRHGERGSALVTVLLLLLTVGLGYLCFSTWNNWLQVGDVGYPVLRAPFDHLAQQRIQKELSVFQNDQRVRRQKLEGLILESRGEEGEIVVDTREREGFNRTLERIRQKEEELRRKEDDLKSKEAALEQSQREITAEILRNNNLLNRISSTLSELQTVEQNRTREISADRKKRIEEMSQMVRNQKAADAATLLLAVAFPLPFDPNNPTAPPFPPDESFEGPDLVLEVLRNVPSTQRGEIMNKMVRVNPEQSAVLFDMMDNPRTGLEAETETAKP